MKEIRSFLLGLALLFLFAAGAKLPAQERTPAPYAGPKENLHMYLLIGQSNMAGRAPLGEEESGVIPRCYLLNGEDRWEPAKNPLNRHSTIRKGLGMQKMNPGYSFSLTMLEAQKDVSIGLVVNAKGGTRIDQWAKGTQFYEEALKRARVAQETGTLKGILWHQGESDSGKPEGYLDKLKALIENLRKDLGDPRLPFVAGEVYYHPKKKPQTKRINEQLARLPDAVPFTRCVKAEDLTTRDNTHFDTAGMKLLGKRYAEAMRDVQGE